MENDEGFYSGATEGAESINAPMFIHPNDDWGIPAVYPLFDAVTPWVLLNWIYFEQNGYGDWPDWLDPGHVPTYQP